MLEHLRERHLVVEAKPDRLPARRPLRGAQHVQRRRQPLGEELERNVSPSSLPSSALVPFGTVTTKRVEIGKSAFGHTTSVFSSAHFASPTSAGDTVSGSEATGLSS
jgi:hypothetical protein